MEKAKQILHSASVSETEQIAERLASLLKPGTVIAYFGGLGAGKTAFTRGLARGLHSDDDVSSPTFALVHEYRCDPPLIHFDMYRITSPDDLYSTGYFDYLDGHNILAIEWSENIEEDLPDDAIIITFERDGDDARIITIEGGPELEDPCN